MAPVYEVLGRTTCDYAIRVPRRRVSCYIGSILPAGARRGSPRMQTNPFATEAADYAHLRPTYPEDLFEFLATVVPSRDIAWDCATGNGEAARHLSRYFQRVIATDESTEMIAQATPDPKIDYRVAEAEDSGIEDRSVRLVTVAAAIHW